MKPIILGLVKLAAFLGVILLMISWVEFSRMPF